MSRLQIQDGDQRTKKEGTGLSQLHSGRAAASLKQRFQFVASSWVFHLFFSGAIMLVVFLRPPAIFSGDTDTARNYLNTIVSSLSTILALCISIILVAIQMTASNYTHRVLDFFVRLPYNASLFLFYLVTIMHSLFLMAKIHDPLRDPLPVSLRPEMSADLVMVVICFISLLVYMYAVVQLLKPERIIDLILRDYNRALYRSRFQDAVDNVEQICDIAKRAASVSDSVTGVRSVEAMSHVASLLPIPTPDRAFLQAVHQKVVDQWSEIVGVAVKERESGLLNAALKALHTQGEQYVKAHAWPVAETVVVTYRQLVYSYLLGDGQVAYVEQVIAELYQLAATAAKEGHRGVLFCLRTWRIIQAVGENAFTYQPIFAASLMEGLVLSPTVEPTLRLLTNPEDEMRGIVSYFQLWKAFASAATVRDAARWAVWWQDNMVNLRVFRIGQLLSVLIVLHVGRQKLAETLCNIWNMTLSDFDVRELSDVVTLVGDAVNIELFDGWPWSRLLEMTGARL